MPRLKLALATTVTYLVTAAILYWPGLLLALSIQALGGLLGLWPGEPTSNDGEEFWGTALGLAAFAVVLALAALVIWLVARRLRLRAMPAALIGTGGIIIAEAIVCGWVVS
jgi:hypothetical protein